MAEPLPRLTLAQARLSISVERVQDLIDCVLIGLHVSGFKILLPMCKCLALCGGLDLQAQPNMRAAVRTLQ